MRLLHAHRKDELKDRRQSAGDMVHFVGVLAIGVSTTAQVGFASERFVPEYFDAFTGARFTFGCLGDRVQLTDLVLGHRKWHGYAILLDQHVGLLVSLSTKPVEPFNHGKTHRCFVGNLPANERSNETQFDN